ncbi:MAG: N-methyl-L-tryptophan oxidase [Cyclobacteriaceae bacterium]
MLKTDFDVAVIGLGSMGLATCYHLAKEGYKVLGVERFAIYNDKSSHVGDTRLIRKSYFEHPDYVPLLHKAYDNWKHLEILRKVKVFHCDGVAYMGDKEGEVLSGVLKSAELHGLHIEEHWSESFEPSVAKHSLWEAEAGYLDVAKVFETYLDAIKELGVQVQDYTHLENWKQQGDCILIQTDAGVKRVEKLVITAGAWTNELLPVSLDLNPTRQVLAWFECDDASFDMPCWCLDHPEGMGIYYGFSKSRKGFKVGHHYPGETIDPNDKKIPITEEEIKNLHLVLQRLAPKKNFDFREAANCIYTNTPDEHFIIDFLPNSDKKIVLAAGFSGHGFKFVSAIGEILSEMIKYEKLQPNASFLSLNRSS